MNARDAHRATADGTARYARRHGANFDSTFYRGTAFDLTTSRIGLGTYLGELDEAQDDAYHRAIVYAVRNGINLLDSAINYRAQRSERALGAAIAELTGSGDVARDELIICTKAGYIPFDRTIPSDRDEYRRYIDKMFVEKEIVAHDDIVAAGHTLAPRFLRYCIAQSRQNLGVRTIDVFYLHNPEQQLAELTADALFERIRAAIHVLEEAVDRGEIGAYGCATWSGLLTPPDAPGHLSLERLVRTAREVCGGDAHHFLAIQLPVNLAMSEAVRGHTQELEGTEVTVLEAAAALGVSVVGSASLMQAKLASGLPPEIREMFPGCRTDAQRALAFLAGVPGLTASLVGMKQIPHVEENLAPSRRREDQSNSA